MAFQCFRMIFAPPDLRFNCFSKIAGGANCRSPGGERAPESVPATSGGVSDWRTRILFVASVSPNLIMMSDAERRALSNAPAADDIDAKAFTAFDPPALAMIGLAQQNLAGRGDRTHVGSHGIRYRMLLMSSVRVP